MRSVKYQILRLIYSTFTFGFASLLVVSCFMHNCNNIWMHFAFICLLCERNVQQELMRDMRFWPKHLTTRQHFFFMKLQVELMLADKKYNILLIVCSQV